MKLEKQDIEHIAKLARIDLTEDELKKYGSQLSGILNYIEQLQEVDVKGIEPTAQVTGLADVFREDVIREWDADEREAALKQAPELEDGQIKVKRVLN
jgi:aspartyl-tRNA(Asn)/glutamyl-tRNA(Gln) amidotransferase subunit C